MDRTLPLPLAAQGGRRRACVLDGALALSPLGLSLAQRLCGEFEVWLVRELWQILDNTAFYLERPERLFTGLGCPVLNGSADAIRETLRLWDFARTEADLAGLNVYWVGDALGGSLLPAGFDAHLVNRYERLAHALDRRAEGVGASGALVQCARDAVALTVALAPSRAVLLTTRESWAPDEPLPAPLLRAWGIPVDALPPGRSGRLEREALGEQLARAAVAELRWAGLDLVAMHIVARRAAAIPAFGGSSLLESDEPDVPDDGDDECDWWADAVAFWYPLTED